MSDDRNRMVAEREAFRDDFQNFIYGQGESWQVTLSPQILNALTRFFAVRVAARDERAGMKRATDANPLLSLLEANIPPEARGILRELAVAEHRKIRYERLLAELDVVIPYLRRRAEKLTPPITDVKFKWRDDPNVPIMIDVPAR